MRSWNEKVDEEFANSWDEIEAFKVWINFDAPDDIVLSAMQGTMSMWMNSERRERARERFSRELEDSEREGRWS